MKTIIKLAALFACLLCFASCDDDTPAVTSLEVTPANLNGTWKLSEWNGQPLDENLYFYIIFNRRDRTFEVYQNMESMYAFYQSGSFIIETDPYVGYIISGEYDFGNGSWNHEYVVTDLMPEGSMVWTAKDNASDVQKFVRCDGVPQDIIDESAKEQ